MSKNWLVTGSSSGLGKFLTGHFQAVGLSRSDLKDRIRENKTYDLIIHCAFSKPKETVPGVDAEFLQQVLKIPHRKFVFVSSVDVYPRDGKSHSEDEKLDLAPAISAYAQAKIQCEAMVQKKPGSNLIIRPASLIGPIIVNQNLKTLLNDEKPRLTLTAASTWNFVTYQELATLVESYENDHLAGVVNLARGFPITVGEVASLLGKSVSFGDYDYKTPALKNERAVAILPELKEASAEWFKRRFKL